MLFLELFFTFAPCFTAFFILALVGYYREECILPFKEYFPGGWTTVIIFSAISLIGFLLLFTGCI